MRLESLSVSTNLRQKAPLIVRLGRHHFASLQVSIIGVFYGGQDYETILQDDSEG